MLHSLQKIYKRTKKQWLTSYQENKSAYYSLGISLVIHLFLLAISSLLLWDYMQQSTTTIGIELSTLVETEQNPMPEEASTTEENSASVFTPTMITPQQVPESAQEQTLPSLEDWKRELFPQQDTPDPLEQQDIPQENTSEKWSISEEKIQQQMRDRQKLLQSIETAPLSIKIMHEGRTKGRQGLLQKGGGNEATQTAVEAGLDWLARHQMPNGSWSCRNFTLQCRETKCTGEGNHWGDPAITAFALLCFLGVGANDMTGKYAENVNRGLAYLLEIQNPSDGCFGPKQEHYMYNHAIATLGMAEGCAFCYDIKYRNSSKRAIDFLLKAQNTSSAWRYYARCGDNDTSVTGWCLLALKAGQTAEITIPMDNINSAKSWLDSVTLPGDLPWVGYTTPSPNNVCMTSVGTTCRIFFYDVQSRNKILGASHILHQHLPHWRQEGNNDFYYWYYGTLAMYQVGGTAWDDWNNALQNALLSHQEKRGCATGSWGYGTYTEGGRVFWTCLNILSLQVYYRYPRFFPN